MTTDRRNLPDGSLTAEEVGELLDRIEELETEVERLTLLFCNATDYQRTSKPRCGVPWDDCGIEGHAPRFTCEREQGHNGDHIATIDTVDPWPLGRLTWEDR